ncbi:MAG: hypothetical protein R3C44_10710 [Chloroflexota bacterium]
MRTRITDDHIPGEPLRREQAQVQSARREVAEVLAETLGFLPPDLSNGLSAELFGESLTDEQLLALAQSELPAGTDERLSDLLDRQQTGELTGEEAQELPYLTQLYEEHLLLKSEAMAAAVERGLLPPLDE